MPEVMVLDFGEVPQGVPAALPLGIANVGDDVLRICFDDSVSTDCTEARATRVEPDPSPFEINFDGKAEDGTWVVDVGGDRQIDVRFTATEPGPIAAALVIVHNGGNGPSTTIELRANGVEPQIDFSTDQLDFGQVTVDQRAFLELVLTNQTQFAQPVTIPPVAQSTIQFGTADEAMVQTPNGEDFVAEVPGNGTLTLQVWYQPDEEGEHTNMLDVQYCPTCSQLVSLRGEGIKPLLELVPASLDFGTIDEGVEAADAFVARNIGNVPLTIYSVGLEPGTTNEFTPTPAQTLPIVLQPTEELTVDVTYLGVTPGDDAGNIEVVTNAWDDPETPVSETVGYVAVMATSRGPDINPFPGAVNFGSVGIMSGGAQRRLGVQNVGNAILTVTDITFNSASAEYSITNLPAFPLTIDPGVTVDLTINYDPQDAGMDTAEVVITSDDRDEGTLTVPVSGIGGVPTTCSISVAPSQVTFGLVERGRTATLPVEVRNAGAQPCTISTIALSGDVEFSITAGGVATTNIPPGAFHRIDVAYAPTAYAMHSTVLEFDSDDPAQPRVQIPITGASDVSDVLIIPSQLDFNVVPVLCGSPNREVTIYNTGSSAVTVNNVYLDPTTSPEFQVQPFATPATIAPGASVIVNVRYFPADIGPDTGILFIDHSDSPTPVAVPLSGSGEVNPTVTDTFSQLPNPQADVMFVVDNSCSMVEEQFNLGTNLGSFLDFADMEGIDYQISVTTTDVAGGGERGAFVGTTKIITPTTPNRNMIFQQNVSLGTSGSGVERGLEAAYLALSDPLINTTNAGFLRNDAALAVIFVSDEEDQSNRAQSFYEDFFRNVKGFQNATLFSASAVVGVTPGGCTSGAGDADYAPRYVMTAQNTGGVVESICNSNWGTTLANIGLNTFGLKRQFQLSSAPVAPTIAVTVDTVQIPSTTPGGQINWSYDMASNSVIFNPGSVPPAGSVIEVTYSVACLQ